jgi:hypothetical protein
VSSIFILHHERPLPFYTLAPNGSFHFLSMTAQGRVESAAAKNKTSLASPIAAVGISLSNPVLQAAS